MSSQRSTQFFSRKQDGSSTFIQLIDNALSSQIASEIDRDVFVQHMLSRPTVMNVSVLFRYFYFAGIDSRYYNQLGTMLSADNDLWPAAALTKDDIIGLWVTKRALVSCIIAIDNPQYKQRALWQALLPCTLLGGIFNIAQGLLGMTPSLSSSGNKKTIAAELLRDIKQYGWQLQHAATEKALHDNVSLQSELQKYSPALYEKLLANGLGQSSSRSMKFAVQSSLFGNTKAGTINRVIMTYKEVF